MTETQARPPIDDIRGVVCDLDGVVYHGPRAVPGAIEALATIRARIPVLYATNNASRSPATVAAHLRELGATADDDQVVTSATVGAHVVAEQLGSASRVLAVGGEGVPEALRAEGLVPVRASELGPEAELPGAVLQGYGLNVTVEDLTVASFTVAGGALWVATNTDLTLPTDRGTSPGNGTLVAAVEAATGQAPQVVGKPGPLMYERCAELAGAPASQMLGIGDRLETDIAGAHAAGMLAAAVLTGVHGPSELAAAPPSCRPNLVLRNLGGLLEPYVPAEMVAQDTARCGGAEARWDGNALVVDGEDDLERLRAALTCVWELQDRDGLTAGAAAEQVRSSVGPVEPHLTGADLR